MAETIKKTTLPYRAGDRHMLGQLFLPGAPGAHMRAVLVFPEAPGPGEHVLGRAARLAEQGFAALACDLHGDGLLVTEFDEIFARLGALRANPSVVLARATAALDALRDAVGLPSSRIAAIGYCFGGSMALELGRSGAKLAGIVGFHSGLLPLGKGEQPGISCPVLTCIGDDDPSISAEERQVFEAELREAGVEWTAQLYGGVAHAFTDKQIARLGRPEFARYDAWADAQSWEAMLRFLDHVLKADPS